ncbi:hypothetical protein RM844_30290 [Streptomyces sp. DSM 44915]|uniref:Lipoprotein n=1 Tax=Streptomyces chisholmiae TaxID=3075540 RepID=A0ABU2JZZ5_9ACTN|nr:hypothetical protein [Streptomyces sp. DSM 44915]MDT0270571.1 hypothetical protein [Streptomyces sp. DSM 44915]
MRTRAAALLAATIATLALAACSSSDDSEADDQPAAEYSVLNEELPDGGIGEVELLMPDATIETAEAAIRDYASSIDGPTAVTVQVVRSEDAAVIVCRADWPEVEGSMNCPDPGGN